MCLPYRNSFRINYLFVTYSGKISGRRGQNFSTLPYVLSLSETGLFGRGRSILLMITDIFGRICVLRSSLLKLFLSDPGGKDRGDPYKKG